MSELELLPLPTVDRTERFAEDARLRRNGFAIHRRPRDGEPLWIKAGVLFTHSEALLRLQPSEGKR
jgi:hypothetical protein